MDDALVCPPHLLSFSELFSPCRSFAVWSNYESTAAACIEDLIPCSRVHYVEIMEMNLSSGSFMMALSFFFARAKNEARFVAVSYFTPDLLNHTLFTVCRSWFPSASRLVPSLAMIMQVVMRTERAIIRFHLPPPFANCTPPLMPNS